MPEFSGPIQHVELAPWLWLIPLLPFLGAVFNAFYSSGLWGKAVPVIVGIFSDKAADKPEAPRKLAPNRLVTTVAVGAMALSFAVVLWHLTQLLALPPDKRFLLDHLWRMVRFGQLDINFDFAFDPLSAVMCLIITGVGSLIHIYATSYMAEDPDFWRFFAWLNLFVFSMLLLVLGDNFFVMFFGWEGVGLCSWGLIGFWWKDYKKATAGMKAFVVNRVGDFGVVMGVALLFWGLGGSFNPDGTYSPDLNARFSSVAITAEAHGEEAAAKAEGGGEAKDAKAAQEPEPGVPATTTAPGQKALDTSGQGYITLTAYPGAVVYMDDSRDYLTVDGQREGPPLFAPFVHFRVSGGYHTFRISPGNGLDDYLVSHLAIGGDKEVALAPFGPTVTFRQIRDQLVVADAHGHHVFRDLLLEKRAWGRMGVICLACLLLFLGACGKSAQVPLYVWLPDAMAGPTPVSALIHAATMVTAGVYMIARLSFLFSLSPTACGVVATVGAVTALFSATIGFFQYDIKKVLAYSTVSQLGFMFIGVGVGAYWAGIFHLMTHAFFKACLFLGAGSVIHGMHAVEHDEVASQDMRNMGGLKKRMPWTARTYFIACLAITAAPIPGFAGFWSKDEILFRAYTTENILWVSPHVIYAIGLIAALGTSFYMWRSYYLTFEGEPRNPAVLTKVHESPAAITYVLWALAVLSTVGGALFGFSTHLLGGPGTPLLEEWLEPALSEAKVHFADPGMGMEWGLMGLSVALALGAWAFARYLYGAGRSKTWDTDEQRVPGWKVLNAKYYVDEIYAATVVRAVLRLRMVLAGMDRWVVDGLVNGVGLLIRAVSWINGTIDELFVDGAVNFVAEGTIKLGNKLRTVQTGRIQNYIYGALGGVAFFAIVQYFLSFNK
jgi:NADH-quinone oxidoreductase subunit L